MEVSFAITQSAKLNVCQSVFSIKLLNLYIMLFFILPVRHWRFHIAVYYELLTENFHTYDTVSYNDELHVYIYT